ncbi:achaete-scute homolog 3-like isoform X2 [Homalodisca vitripennis]|nr:achaete-scute homolog 3-like isoform X2 [Homalodisca vitripennis]
MKVSAVGGSEVLRAKPPQLVARRNARERRRVQAVNSAFARLRRVVPLEHSRGKRVSKVKTLQRAIEYISSLLSLLRHPQHHPWEYRVFVPVADALQYNFQ